MCFAGLLFWHYSGRPNIIKKALSRRSAGVDESSSDKFRSKKLKVKGSFLGEASGNGRTTPTPSNEGSISKKRKIASTESRRPVNGPREEAGRQTSRNEEGGLDNMEFAKQLTQARTGSELQPASGKGDLSKKEKRARKAAAAATSSTESGNTNAPQSSADASSANGGDADDDLSPDGSPPLKATEGGSLPRAGDISDMLEARRGGPAILRLIDSKGTVSQQKKSGSKPFEVIESKKQRQSRQKREAQKLRNEEAEALRRLQMEQQLRIARTAEGSSAQTKSSTFKPPTENAWFAGGKGSQAAQVQKTPVHTMEERDTKEQGTVTGSVSAAPLSNLSDMRKRNQTEQAVKQEMRTGPTEVVGTSSRENSTMPGSSTQSNASWADMPSEEEQIRMLREEDAWTTVASKKDKKKGGRSANGVKEPDTTSEASADVFRAKGTNMRRPTTDGALKGNESSNRYISSDQQDSEWAA